MLFASLLRRGIRRGCLTVVAADGCRHECGDPGTGPAATIKLHDPALHWQLFANPWLRFGEAYMDGTLTVEEGSLHDVFAVAMLNFETLMGSGITPLIHSVERALRWAMQRNPVGKAQRNVAHHYDLSRRLFALFLDESMQYSCAYFPTPDASLADAQRAKMRHIAAKLLLRPGQRVLDIGSGWGGLGIYLARTADVEVLGLTLSKEQLAVARDRAAAAGLSDRVRFELRDYREETGSYDRIVSVGMFEHVGVKHFPEYFGMIRTLLADDGVALLHSIGRRDGPGTTNAWIRKYIFPGGYSPALSEVLPVVERSHLWVTDVEILRLHYAETLRHWHRNFIANRAEIERLYDQRFCRMWEFYLVGSEMSFRCDVNMVFQMQLAKRIDAVPLTRDYMVDGERALSRGLPQSAAAAD
ncbi:MAG: class I SAM-dependent methyltransferase [Alphaproteobacteria bacterium]|nr:class I SAM-dependent methyltransferase [Alphaproteobacteria bacterium]